MDTVGVSLGLLLAAAGQLNVTQPPPPQPDITVVATAASSDRPGSTRLETRDIVDLPLRSLDDLPLRLVNVGAVPGGVMGIGQVAIRGIRSPAGAASVIVYLDDVPIQVRPSGFTATSDLQILDLDRVEIERGPQGTRGGMGALAGTIRFVSRAPDPATTSASASAFAEGRTTRFGADSYRVGAIAGGPVLGERIAVRGAIMAQRAGGYVDRVDPVDGRMVARDANRIDAAAARLSLAAALGDGWTVTPAIHLQRSIVGDLPLTESDRGALAQAFVTRQPGRDRLAIASLSIVRTGATTRFSAVTSLLDRRQYQATDYSRAFGELVLGGAIPGLSTPGGSSSLVVNRQRNWTQDIRLASTDSDSRAVLAWTAGLFATDASLRIDQSLIDPGLPALVGDVFGATINDVFGAPLLPGAISFAARERDRETRLAVYADATWRPIPTLSIGAGVRASRAAVTIDVAAAGPYAGQVDFTTERGRRIDRVLTPRATIGWTVGTRNHVSITAARGYRPGGANAPVPATACAADLAALGRATAPTDYTSDTLWSYDLGIAHHGNRLRIDHDLFLIDWDDIAQQIDLPGCGFGFVANAGRARSRGFETTLALSPVPGLRLSGAIGFTDARFRATMAGIAGTTPIARRGDRVPGVPRWTATLAAEARRPTGSGTVRVRVDYAFSSAYRRAPSPMAFGYDSATYRGDPTHRADLLIAHDWRRWSLTAFVENLADARPVLLRNTDLVPATGTPIRETTFRPRTIGLRTAVAL